MPLMTIALAAGGLVLAPMQLNSALSAIQSHGAKRLQVTYEGLVPLPLLGQVKAAEASMTADIGPTGYSIRTLAKAAGVVDWFVDYNLDISSQGTVGPGGLAPTHYVSANRDGKKNRHVTVDFSPTDVATKVTPKFGDYGYPPATLEQKLEAMDPPTAIIQQMLTASSLPGNACGGPIRAFDGKQRFDLKLTYSSRIAYKSRAYTGAAIVCTVEYVEIAGFKNKTDAQKAKDKADIQWTNMVLADLDGGAVRPILKIEAKSKKRGKLTIQATRLSYGPVPAR